MCECVEDQEGEEEEDQLEHQLFGDDEPPAMDFGPFYGGMLDPDVDVGLYGEEDDDYELYDDEDNEEDEDDFDDDEEGWDVQLGHEGAVDNFQMNLHEFRVSLSSLHCISPQCADDTLLPMCTSRVAHSEFG